jgi:hypothetical protein
MLPKIALKNKIEEWRRSISVESSMYIIHLYNLYNKEGSLLYVIYVFGLPGAVVVEIIW